MQLLLTNTKHRFGQEPSCLDLFLSDKDELIENLKIGDKLGASDHNSIYYMSIWKRRGKSTET